MNIGKVIELLEAKTVTRNTDMKQELLSVLASDLMSDVLTVDGVNLLLLTGLNNIQTIRTAEMAEVSMVVIVRGKKATDEMIALAEDNEIMILESDYSLFRASGILYEQGLASVY